MVDVYKFKVIYVIEGLNDIMILTHLPKLLTDCQDNFGMLDFTEIKRGPNNKYYISLIIGSATEKTFYARLEPITIKFKNTYPNTCLESSILIDIIESKRMPIRSSILIDIIESKRIPISIMKDICEG